MEYLAELDLPASQLFMDAELDVFSQNMLQCEDLSPFDLAGLLDQPLAQPSTLPSPFDTGFAEGSAGDVPGIASQLGRPGSVTATSGSLDSSHRHGSSESAAQLRDDQQLYASMFEGLMPHQTTYPPSGPMTVVTAPQPALLQHAPGSGEGSNATGSGTLLGTPPGSGEGLSPESARFAAGSPGGTSGGVSATTISGAASGGPSDGGTCSPGGGGSNAQSAGEEATGSGRAGGRAANGGQVSVNREKHRSAQRRYRARLRAKHEETDQRVAELTRMLNESMALQASLAQRNLALEQHLAAQETLASQQPAVQPPPIPSPTPPPAVQQQQQSSPSDQSTAAVSAQSPAAEQPALSNRYKLNDQTWELIKSSVGAADDSLTFTVDPNNTVSYTRRELCNFTTTQYKDLWKGYVNEFAVCLMRCDGNTDSPAYPRLLQLLAETRALKLTFCMLRPDLMSAWAQYAAEQRGMPTADFWRGIANSLTIPPQQLHKMILVRNAALRNLGAMMAERRALLATLGSGLGVTQQLEGMASIDALDTKSAAQRMDALLRNENSFIAEISTVVTEDVLEPLQLAHVITLAWPFGVNIMAIMNVVAARAGAAPVADMLQLGAAAGGAGLTPLRAALVAP